jgi:eukaryotic-like serine/threonine-protein kinase
LARNYRGISDLALRNLRPDQALESISSAFDVFGDHPTGEEDHDRMLIGLYLARANSLNELGKQSEALADDRNAVELAGALVDKSPSSVQARRSLYLGYHETVLMLAGRDGLNVGDSGQARSFARKALAIAQALAALDHGNVQAQYDLADAYSMMGDSYRQTDFDKAAAWYRKSVELTRDLAPSYGAGARHWLAVADEDLAEVLNRKEQAPERLQLLLEANLVRRELSETSPHGRLHLMRSYCKLSDAELAAGNVGKAREYADAARPFMGEFSTTSPSLLVLRDVGSCFASEAGFEHSLATDKNSPPALRVAAETESRSWYEKSLNVWTTWNTRGAATPESERERRKVELALKRSPTNLQQALKKTAKLLPDHDRVS